MTNRARCEQLRISFASVLKTYQNINTLIIAPVIIS